MNDAVAWDANTLTLNAPANINVNAVMTATGAASLTLSGTPKMGLPSDGSGFTGRVDFNSTGQLISQGNTYTQIRTQDDLQNMSMFGRYFLGTDVALSGPFTPIGLGQSFAGALDGLGHKITGLEINLPSSNNIGLFSQVGGNPGNQYYGFLGVRNLGVVLGDAGVVGGTNVGGLAGTLTNVGVVTNSYVSGTGAVSGTGNNIGGLIGTVGERYCFVQLCQRGGQFADL